MSSFSDYLEDAVLNYVFRNTGAPTSTDVYLAIFTVSPSDTGGGTEVSGAGYARQITAFDASSGGAITNTAAESFTASVTSGNLLAWDSIASTTIADGDKITFPIGNINISLT